MPYSKVYIEVFISYLFLSMGRYLNALLGILIWDIINTLRMRWILLLVLVGCTTVELTAVNTCIGTLSHHSSEYNAIAEAGIGWARPHPGPFSWGYTK